MTAPAWMPPADPLSAPHTASAAVAFSAYPGTLASIDDMYVTSAGLFVTETTNDVFNVSLYALLTPQSVTSWVRAVVANRVAADGPEWADVYGRAGLTTTIPTPEGSS